MGGTQNYVDTLAPMVESIARSFANQFGVEAEDVSQELLLWILTHERNLNEWYHNKEQQEFTSLAAASLRNAAKAYAAKVKMQQMGYDESVLAWYSRNAVEQLLPFVFDREAWLEPEKSESGAQRGDPATGGNWMVTLADVSRAMGKLTAPQNDLLEVLYRDQVPINVVAKAQGVSPQAISQRKERAIERLVDALGGERPNRDAIHPGHAPWECAGTRKAITNAAARAVTAQQYDGGNE